MSIIDEILQFNEEFVNGRGYESFVTDKYPNKKVLIITCMDTRLIELLPQAMNIRNGDAKEIKTAGALISEPYGSVMRSVLVAVSLLKAEEVLVIGHLDCGMIGLQSTSILEALSKRGVKIEEVASQLQDSKIDVNSWLTGFSTVEEGVRESVRIIKNHPLFPSDVLVHGLTIHPTTGRLELIVDGRVEK